MVATIVMILRESTYQQMISYCTLGKFLLHTLVFLL